MHGGGQRVAIDLATCLPGVGVPNSELWTLGLDNALPIAKHSAQTVAFDGRYNRLDSLRRSAAALRAKLRAHDVAVLQTHGYDADLVGALAVRGTPVRQVCVLHVTAKWLYSQSWKHRVRRIITRRLLGKRSTLRTGVSAAVQRHWCDALGWSRDAVTVVHNGIELSAFPPVERERDEAAPFRVGFAGRLAEMKGVHHLVDSVATLRNDDCEVTASIAGEGPLRESLARRAKATGDAEAVRFLGQIDDVGRFFGEIDALVLPSLDTEGLPLVLLEAMSSGLPCVATDVGGSAEAVVDGETGFVVPRGDTDALANVIRTLAQDRKRAAAMGQAGRTRAEAAFSRERMAADYVRLFRQRGLLPALEPTGAGS